MTDQPLWMVVPATHLPESSSELFVYQPQGNVDSTWMNAIVDSEYPLRVELFTPDDQEVGLRLTARDYDIQLKLAEGSCIDLEFANPMQRKAFFRMVLELADWIKEHHHGDLSAV